jgi:hypothetical protein
LLLATIEKIVRELDDLFVIFNFMFYGGDLMKPVIAVQSNERRHGAIMGWCTTRKVWTQTETKEEYYEITVCPEFFDLGLVELCDTLLHEFVHLYNLQIGVQDVSRGGYYHNKLFKQEAERRGLIVEKIPVYGWTKTRPSPDTLRFVESLKIDRAAFNLMRKRLISISGTPEGQVGQQPDQGSGASDATPPPRQSYRKYVCPSCGMAVRATKDVRVKCADCDALMEKQEKKRS